MSDELTPMMRQYLAIKREVPRGAILMFRLGDFYEMFGEDAVVAAPILGATLTRRGSQPMCGIPYTRSTRISRGIHAARRAPVNQVETRRPPRGSSPRSDRIVTPGR